MPGGEATVDLPWRVLVTEPIDAEAMAMLRSHAEVVTAFGDDAQPLEEALTEVHGLVVRRKHITKELLAGARHLRVISRPGVGYENIDVDAATAMDIPVLITADANNRSVAELVFALALAALRNLPRWDRVCRSGGFAHREHSPGRELSGKRMGLIGIGRVGSTVARIAKHGFDMDVLGYHPTRTDDELRARGVEPFHDLHDFLAQCDIVSVQVPLTDQTRNLISTDELASMKPGSILINVARGGIVDEQALVRALEDGHLAAAGIDVFEQEPPPFDHPLFSLENVVLSPHRAGRTVEAVQRMGTQAVRGLLMALGGDLEGTRADDSPVTLVNPATLASARTP